MFQIKSYCHDLLYRNSYSRAFFTLWGVMIKEIKVSFLQFFTWKYPLRSFFRTWTIIYSSLARLLLGRSLKYSYAFAGEDRIIEGIVKPKISATGFYVDVGCNHPKFLSNTYGLYRKGWRGVCIDANQELVQKYSFYRPKDIAVCALVSDTQSERTFYQVQNDVLSTTEEEFLKSYNDQGMVIENKKMTTQTLTEVLEKVKAPLKFDILSIDAEEHDVKVLRSLDLNYYEPRLIIIEDETFDHLNFSMNEIYQYLTRNGYVLAGFVLKNLYFKKN